MVPFLQRHRTLVGWGGAAISLVIAVVYLFVVPGEAEGAGGFAAVVLRYGHSVVWILLAATGVAFAMRRSKRVVAGIASAALIVYAVFIATLLFASAR